VLILIDANILMYAAGADHSNKTPSVELLRLAAEGHLAATVDAEILQEIIHRYTALRRWSEGRQVYDLARKLFSEVQPITGEVMDEARRLIDTIPALSARDAVHAAVVIHHKLEGIATFDTDFDHIPHCQRLDPVQIVRRHRPRRRR
jgi:hypothetical protein